MDRITRFSSLTIHWPSRKGKRCRSWRTRWAGWSHRPTCFPRRTPRPGRRERYARCPITISIILLLSMSQQVFPEEALAVVREVHHGGGEGHLVAAVDSVGGEVVDGEHTNYFQPFLFLCILCLPCFVMCSPNSRFDLPLWFWRWTLMPSGSSVKLSRLRVRSFGRVSHAISDYVSCHSSYWRPQWLDDVIRVASAQRRCCHGRELRDLWSSFLWYVR